MRLLTLFCSLFLAAGGLRADNASEALAFQTALADNLKLGSAFLAEPLVKGLAFAVGSQSFSPVQAKPLLGFNVGLGMGASTTGIDKAALKAAAQSNGTSLSGLAAGLPDSLPIPLGSLNAHIGLPKFFFFEAVDLGVRLSSLDVSSSDTSIKLAGSAFELRGNIFEAGLVSPVTLTLGLGFEQLRTEFRVKKALAATSGSYGAASYSGESRYKVDLDSTINLSTFKASISRKFFFITPYAGLALNMLSGDSTLRSAHEGTLTFDNAGGAPYVLSGTIEGKSVKAAPGFDAKVAAGLELSLFALYLGFGGEYGILSQGVGGHGQIGLQFR